MSLCSKRVHVKRHGVGVTLRKGEILPSYVKDVSKDNRKLEWLYVLNVCSAGETYFFWLHHNGLLMSPGLCCCHRTSPSFGERLAWNKCTVQQLSDINMH